MRDYLEKLIATRKAKLEKLEQRNKEAQTVEELRSIGAEIDECRTELRDAEATLAMLEEREKNANPFPTGSAEARAQEERDLSYRKAFKDFVQRGVAIPAELREAGPTVTGDVSALIPKQIMDEVLLNTAPGDYGQLYNRVRKMGIPFGVAFPISQLKATFSWINETTCIVPEKAGDANTYVTFGANIGSVAFSQSILVTIEALDVFEREMGRLLREAFYKAMDTAIMKGTGSGQPKGILTEPRVNQTVTFSDKSKDIDDWKKWNALLWAKIPADKQNGVLIVGRSTWYTHLLNVSDANNRPLAYDSLRAMGETGIVRNFMGRTVIMVEDDILKSYDTASQDTDVIALWGDLYDYGLNELQGFGLRRYEDNKCHQTITEGLVVADGHVLEAYGFFKCVKGA